MTYAFARGTRRRFTAGIATVAAVSIHSGVHAQEATPSFGGMTIDETQQVLDRYREAIFGTGDFGRSLSPEELAAFLSEDVVLRYLDSGEEGTGPDDLVTNIAGLYTVQFDARATVVSSIVGGGKAAIEGVVEGTHTGEFAGIPPTAVAVNVPYSAFYTMESGRITEVRVYGLHGGLAAQITAAAPDATPAG